ncbi:hypothetical protein [Deinococcus ruber]|uniref:Uncharacterized protein n=1 Tax=Deinococcus ruber TaxID=1848197 RepID=A0A918F722_9DEIO|nr:hypothetical protein [Deinococcus ruber]GGR11406.1 hypothetical protein GCM10008957_25220 [Deinococcus ruber]
MLYAQQRLAALAIPVLLPGEFKAPRDFVPPGEELGGLAAYLAGPASGGYVQLSGNTGLLSDGVTDTSLAVVIVTAPGATPEAARVTAEALARAVRMQLGHRSDSPSYFRYQRTNVSQAIEYRAWQVQDIYQVNTVLGTV